MLLQIAVIQVVLDSVRFAYVSFHERPVHITVHSSSTAGIATAYADATERIFVSYNAVVVTFSVLAVMHRCCALVFLAKDVSGGMILQVVAVYQEAAVFAV
jgi:hypothetical protein